MIREIEIVFPAGTVRQTITDRIIRAGKIYELLSSCKTSAGLSAIYVTAEELEQRLAVEHGAALCREESARPWGYD